MRRIMIARRNNLRDHDLLRRARGMALAGSGAGEGRRRSWEGATKVDPPRPPAVVFVHVAVPARGSAGRPARDGLGGRRGNELVPELVSPSGRGGGLVQPEVREG
jgi:hypothetical protein